MAERATIFQTVQIGVQAVPGTGVAANKKLGSLSIEPGVSIETTKFRPAGSKYPALVIPQKEYVKANLSGMQTYTELIYPLASVLNYAAPAQQGGTAAYKWTFAPKTAAADTVKQFTVEQGSAVRAHKFIDGLVTALSLNFSRGGCELSGEMIGAALEDNIHLSTNATYTLTAAATPPSSGTFTLTFVGQTTAAIQYNATPAQVQAALEALSTIGTGNVLVTATVAEGAGTLAVAANVYTVEFIGTLAQGARTLTGTFTSLTPSGSIALAAGVVGAAPTELELVPVLATQIDIYLADSAAGLDAADPLERAISASWSISGRFGPVFPLATASGTGFATTVETEPDLAATLKMEADAEGMALLTNMRQGSTKFMRIKAVGDTIEDAYKYKLQIDIAVKVANVSEFSDEEGLFAIEWTFAGVHDGTWTKATQIEIINKLTAL